MVGQILENGQWQTVISSTDGSIMRASSQETSIDELKDVLQLDVDDAVLDNVWWVVEVDVLHFTVSGGRQL